MRQIGAGLAILGLAQIAAPLPVSADWQYTRWGMSPDEVIASRPAGEVIRIPAKGRDESILLEAAYEASGFRFRARFGFDRTGLSKVHLIPVNPENGPRVAEILYRTYGKPISESHPRQTSPGCFSRGSTWRDDSERNQISYSQFACPALPPDKIVVSITYQPLVSSKESGF